MKNVIANGPEKLFSTNMWSFFIRLRTSKFGTKLIKKCRLFTRLWHLKYICIILLVAKMLIFRCLWVKKKSTSSRGAFSLRLRVSKKYVIVWESITVCSSLISTMQKYIHLPTCHCKYQAIVLIFGAKWRSKNCIFWALFAVILLIVNAYFVQLEYSIRKIFIIGNDFFWWKKWCPTVYFSV